MIARNRTTPCRPSRPSRSPALMRRPDIAQRAERLGTAGYYRPVTSSDRPTFVVGTPREGTTIRAAMLGAHPVVDCGPETRFFSWFDRADGAALLDPAHWPDRAAPFVTSLALQDSPVHRL